MNIRYPTILTFLILANPTFGTILFSDSFENPPDVAGANPVNWTVSNSQIVVTDSRASAGSQSLFIRNGPNRLVTQSTAISIPDGGADLQFSFDFALASTTETGEGLIGFNLDFGSGFTTILNDEGQTNGYANVSPYSGSTIILPNDAGGDINFFNYTITIPATQYGAASTFAMQFNTNSSAGAENFYLDNIVVSTVPEPSIYTLLLSTFVLFVILRCRKNRGR
ncbi:hypothetical protein [Rubellicoccus peritrichatus]|uniref:Uncharacterized protein n=1 Tax=Rubellicoccus peritrichatus TaxID=3080537 RepID=A0AAQ3L8B1_9BACT|nr:hypothetical protein [Puniceicoccus sp. CR14]WOO39502.1 hypothetical protein RZN69_12835 [Puniceicoccus sp. CR14]